LGEEGNPKFLDLKYSSK